MSLCEKSFKRLRGTQRPLSELKSIDIRHRIVWKLFGNIRYESDAAKKWVPKFQSLIRMRHSRRRWVKVFRARRLLLQQEGETRGSLPQAVSPLEKPKHQPSEGGSRSPHTNSSLGEGTKALTPKVEKVQPSKRQPKAPARAARK
jgi:hypothetical protein